VGEGLSGGGPGGERPENEAFNPRATESDEELEEKGAGCVFI